MATETTVRVARARYGGFVATFTWNGQWNRVFFENALEVAAELADQCVDADTIEHVIDAFEQMEWSDSTYPLFMPAEAACDSPIDEPVYPPGTVGHEMRQFRPASPFWTWAADSLRIGAAAAPWVLLVIVGRIVWGWL